MKLCVSFNKIVLKVVARVPIFYLRVGKSIRLATRNCLGYMNLSSKQICLGASGVSGYKLVNGYYVSCHGTFYYLLCGKPNVFMLLRIFDNGPAVW